MDHGRNRKRFGKSDDELVELFVSAVGVKAQSYEPSGRDTDANAIHLAKLAAIRRRDLSRIDTTAATLAQLPPEQQRLLRVVYTPHAAPTWLQDALSTPWGGGSFVQLAVTLPRATTAAQERPEGRTVLDWIIVRGRRSPDRLLESLRDDGEKLRVPALEAYEILRRQRIRQELEAGRQREKDRSEKNMRLYSETVGRRARKERDRFDRRTGATS